MKQLNDIWPDLFIGGGDATRISLIQRSVGTSRFPKFYRELYPLLSPLGKKRADELIEIECKRKKK